MTKLGPSILGADQRRCSFGRVRCRDVVGPKMNIEKIREKLENHKNVNIVVCMCYFVPPF